MSLKDEVAALNIVGTGNRVENILNSLPQPDRIDLVDLLDEPTITSRAIALALTARGHSVSERTVQRYRQSQRESL